MAELQLDGLNIADVTKCLIRQDRPYICLYLGKCKGNCAWCRWASCNYDDVTTPSSAAVREWMQSALPHTAGLRIGGGIVHVDGDRCALVSKVRAVIDYVLYAGKQCYIETCAVCPQADITGSVDQLYSRRLLEMYSPIAKDLNKVAYSTSRFSYTQRALLNHINTLKVPVHIYLSKALWTPAKFAETMEVLKSSTLGANMHIRLMSASRGTYLTTEALAKGLFTDEELAEMALQHEVGIAGVSQQLTDKVNKQLYKRITE